MIGYILALLSLIANGMFFSAIFKKQFLKMLPFAFFGIISALYLFGLAGLLRAGVYAVLSVSAVFGIADVVFLIRSRKSANSRQDGIKRTQPTLILRALPLFIFLVVSATILYISFAKTPTAWDEFSHWALAAKAMVYHNAFVTDPGFGVYFTSYPPAMSLFQYYMQVCNSVFGTSPQFVEWLLYAAYGEAIIILILPWLPINSQPKKKDVVPIVILAAILLIAPLYGFSSLYSNLYIDGFLAIIAAYALFLAAQEKSFVDIWLMGLTLLVLFLTKDAAKYFAYVAVIINTITAIFLKCNRNKTVNYKVTAIIIPILFVAFAQISWNCELASKNAALKFSNSIELSQLSEMLNSGSYHLEVVKNFIDRFFSQNLSFRLLLPFQYNSDAVSLLSGNTSFFALSLFYTGFCLAIYIKSKRSDMRGFGGTRCLLLSSVFIYAVYVIGLLVIYLFKFGKYEAVNLASYNRYMNIGYVSWLMIILYSKSEYFYGKEKTDRKRIVTWMLILVFVISINGSNLKTLATRYHIQESRNTQASYNIKELANEIIPEDAKVYIVSQQDSGLDYWVLRYELYPRSVNAPFTWAFGDPDTWTIAMTAQQWKEELETYDYVILFNADKYIFENMSACFAEGTDILSQTIYRVDKSTGLLVVADE